MGESEAFVTFLQQRHMANLCHKLGRAAEAGPAGSGTGWLRGFKPVQSDCSGTHPSGPPEVLRGHASYDAKAGKVEAPLAGVHWHPGHPI